MRKFAFLLQAEMVDQSFIDYYALLNISFPSSEQEIKSAFRKQAMEHHPDRHPDNTAYYNDKFREITAAYEVLSHPFKKGDYDLQYRQFVLKEFPQYEYITDTTPPDTTTYSHLYTRRSKKKVPFYAFIILLIVIFQLVKMVAYFTPVKKTDTFPKYENVDYNFSNLDKPDQ